MARDEAPPLDLEHLSRQCLGDRDLMTELMTLFQAQARALAAQLAGERLAPAAKADVAHRLRGSSLAVGAFAVARAAAAVEACGRDGAGVVEMSQAVAALGEAVSRAAAEIDRLKA
jgi:HPt (histidine-containing phosphotransfer) domain-containing protein